MADLGHGPVSGGLGIPDAAIFNDDVDMLHCVDICHRIAIDHDDVRELAGLDRSEFIELIEDLGIGLGRRRDDLDRRHATVYER